MNRLEDWIENKKLVRRLILLWAVLLITAVTIKVFWFPLDIPNGTAMAFGSVLTILGTAVGLYQWLRSKQDENNSNKSN